MSRLDHKMLPAPPGHLLFTQLFLVGPSRNRTGFCYNDERADCCGVGPLGRHSTHTHTLTYYTYTILMPHTHSCILYTHIYTLIYSTQNFTHTQSPPYTQMLYTSCTPQPIHPYSIHLLYPTLTLGHRHPGTPYCGLVGQDSPQVLWPLKQP